MQKISKPDAVAQSLRHILVRPPFFPQKQQKNDVTRAEIVHAAHRSTPDRQKLSPPPQQTMRKATLKSEPTFYTLLHWGTLFKKRNHPKKGLEGRRGLPESVRIE